MGASLVRNVRCEVFITVRAYTSSPSGASFADREIAKRHISESTHPYLRCNPAPHGTFRLTDGEERGRADVSKQRTFLVAYDAKGNPLTHPEGQLRLEEDHDWTVEHAFRGIWVVRTVLPPEVVVRRVSGILRPTGQP